MRYLIITKSPIQLSPLIFPKIPKEINGMKCILRLALAETLFAFPQIVRYRLRDERLLLIPPTIESHPDPDYKFAPSSLPYTIEIKDGKLKEYEYLKDIGMLGLYHSYFNHELIDNRKAPGA